MPFEKDPNEIGVLWTKSGRRGDYFTGIINGEGVVVFATNAKSPKAPQWRVLKAQKKDEADQRPEARVVRTDDLDDF